MESASACASSIRDWSWRSSRALFGTIYCCRAKSTKHLREEETLALLFRDGAMPLSETLCAAKKWKRAAFWGCLLGTLCALGGMMILAFLTGKGAFSAADPCNILLYLLLWSMPVKLVRGIITKN